VSTINHGPFPVSSESSDATSTIAHNSTINFGDGPNNITIKQCIVSIEQVNQQLILLVRISDVDSCRDNRGIAICF